MFIAFALINEIFKTYLESLKRDLGEVGFRMILMIALNSWVGLCILAWLFLTNHFEMPVDPWFYVLWFGLAVLTEMSFAIFLLGMLNTTFFVASSLGNISFAITALYAGLFLHESYSPIQVGAILITAAGTLLFFKRGAYKKLFTENKGVLLILFSLVMTPLEYVFYKSATLHANSYYQFLTGRLAMDFVLYTLFFVAMSLFWYRKNPLPQIRAFVSSNTGKVYVGGHAATELLESWLIYYIPISLFTMLGTLSIPIAYLVGQKKYREPPNVRHIVGAVLVALGIVLFLIERRPMMDF